MEHHLLGIAQHDTLLGVQTPASHGGLSLAMSLALPRPVPIIAHV